MSADVINMKNKIIFFFIYEITLACRFHVDHSSFQEPKNNPNNDPFLFRLHECFIQGLRELRLCTWSSVIFYYLFWAPSFSHCEFCTVWRKHINCTMKQPPFSHWHFKYLSGSFFEGGVFPLGFRSLMW